MLSVEFGIAIVCKSNVSLFMVIRNKCMTHMVPGSKLQCTRRLREHFRRQAYMSFEAVGPYVIVIYEVCMGKIPGALFRNLRSTGA